VRRLGEAATETMPLDKAVSELAKPAIAPDLG
jgi:hypothetical protein